MRIVQLLPTLSYGDGVGNDTLALHKILLDHGYKAFIYAENIDKRIKKGIAHYVSTMFQTQDDDIILYHLSTGTELNRKLETMKGKKVIIYHNVTPPVWFEKYDQNAYNLCAKGLKGVQRLANVAEFCFADSGFNLEELVDNGYRCEKEVLPILIPFDDYDQPPNKKVMEKYNNDKTKIIFTGRIAPNKKQEDLITAFYYYRKFYNKDAQLFLVGSYNETDRYYLRLKEYVEQLGVEEVYFTGHIKFDEILAYYKMADVFLCLSEHEGFCIPLLEAMYFNLPVVAYSNTGVTWTMGQAGFLLEEKNPLEVAGVLNKVETDQYMKDKMIESEKERLKFFDHKKIEQQFINWIKEQQS